MITVPLRCALTRRRAMALIASITVIMALPTTTVAAAPAPTAATSPPVALAADIAPGREDSRPEGMTALGDTLYFGAVTDETGFALWGYRAAADGGQGEAVVLDPFGNPFDIEPLDGILYYQSGLGEQLRSYDPATGEVEVEVARNGPDAGEGGVPNLAALDGKLYYTAASPDQGYELWVFDPAAAGGRGQATRIARNIAPGPADAAPVFLTPLAGKLYLNARTGGQDAELWVYDPSTDKASLAADINPGPASSDPRELLAVDGRLYFQAEDARGAELWKYDPVAGSASLVADIFPGAASSRPHDLTALGEAVYFGAADPEVGDELWQLDLATDDVVLAADINPFPGGPFPGSSPDDLSVLDGRLYFSASYRPFTIQGAGDLELWEYDPSGNGGAGAASLVAEIRPGSERSAQSAEVDDLEVLDGILYFEARGTSGGLELWSYTPAPVELAAAVLGGDEVEQPGTAVVNAFLRNRTDAPIGSGLRLEITAPDGRRYVRTAAGGTTLAADGVAVVTLGLPVSGGVLAGRYVATLSVLLPGGQVRLSDTFSFTVLARSGTAGSTTVDPLGPLAVSVGG